MKTMLLDRVLEIVDLRIEFRTFEGISKVINGIDLIVNKKEVVGLVGESGCGKSVTAKAILNILPVPANITRGEVILNGFNLLNLLSEKSLTLRKKELSFVPQDPASSLNPIFTIGQQMAYMSKWKEAENFSLIRFIINFFIKEAYKKEREKSIEFLKRVGIADAKRVMKSYPFELSGGTRQRILIAMALMSNPSLIIFDEPTTNLDVSVQDQVLELIEHKIKERDNAVLYITHNLGVAKRLCSRIYALYAGEIVETADTPKIFEAPKHPYTKNLLQAIPRLDGKLHQGIPGRTPNYYDPPTGCRYNPRCKYKMPICEKEKPRLRKIKPVCNHYVACHLFEDHDNE